MAAVDQRLVRIEQALEQFPDFPQPGVLFRFVRKPVYFNHMRISPLNLFLHRDIFPVCRDPTLFGELIDVLSEHVSSNCAGVEAIVALEARGFLFGPSLASRLQLPFVPIRKKGKLPGECLAADYVKEYGKVKMLHRVYRSLHFIKS